MSLQMPSWLDELPQEQQQQARLRFLVRLAAIYATPQGTVAELSKLCGMSANSLASMSVQRPFVTPELAVCIEQKAGHPQITREEFRPDLFVKA